MRLRAFALLLSAAAAPHPLQTGTRLVLIGVQVSDRAGRFLAGLDRSRFRVFDDGVEQPVLSCAVESAVVSTGIVLDASGSMEQGMELSRAAIREFVGTSDPQDEFSLTVVRDGPEPQLGFSTQPEPLLDRVSQTASGGRTALRDAIYLAADRMRKARNQRRALLIVSDGGENHSHYRASEVRSLIREMGITVYVIGLSTGSARSTSDGRAFLRGLAKESGGRYFPAYSIRDLPRLMRNIDIRDQYVLAFSPPVSEIDGKYHRVRVEVTGAERLILSWRHAYSATD